LICGQSHGSEESQREFRKRSVDIIKCVLNLMFSISKTRDQDVYK